MSLRKKNFSIICLTFIVFVGVIYSIARKVMLDSYTRLENHTVTQNIKRFQNALSENLSYLNTSSKDWAA
jgi:sensor domain CHASE-containing protein